MTEVLDAGPAAGQASAGQVADDADLAVFVDRLAAAGSDRCTRLATAQIRRCLYAGAVPPGLRMLAEALAASVEVPSSRRPVDDPGSVAAAMHGNNQVVLEDFGSDAVAEAVAALLTDGRRVIVTAMTSPELTAVRGALPAEVAGRAVDRLPALPHAELRELRRLFATSTPGRRARRDQQLPPASALPPVAEVAQLCGQVGGTAGGEGPGLIAGLLAGIEPERRAAVTSVAGWVDRSLGALRSRNDRAWTWSLLSDLIYSRHRATFDRVLEDSAQAAEALDAARQAPPVTLIALLPDDAVEALFRYLDFLESGGCARSYFRPAAQREAQPVLRQIRVGGQVPETASDVRLVLRHLEIGERLKRIEAGCARMGIPAPRHTDELGELSDGLVKVAAAARSVGALRHDVLFLHPNSPLAASDVAAAEKIAAAILEYSERGSAVEAGRVLHRMADDLAAQAVVRTTAPEHDRAVAALRDRDPDAYAEAVEALAAARREVQDEARRTVLLERLRDDVPRLAGAWSALGDPATGLGIACFLPMKQLLAAVPPPDSADVVLVLGAARLGVERLLLTAVAPRMIAVVGPGERPNASPTLLSVLQRAAALVIRGRPGTPDARVVQLAPGARPVHAQTRTQVG